MKRIPTLTLGLAAMTALALAGCTSASDVQDGAANASAIPSSTKIGRASCRERV